MSEPSKKIIAVFGATGQQGGGVVRSLRAQGQFSVRAITRDASKAQGLADEVVEADLTKPETLAPALEGVHGVFAVTNFWAGPDVDELAQGRAVIDAAKRAGVEHFVWSTLPDVETIGGGRFEVPHFTHKARVDALVSAAGFGSHTFVEAPFYYQNLIGQMAPQTQEDGSKAWTVPMKADARVIHMGDIQELGDVVAGAFAHPREVGQGQHLALAGDFMSWNDIAATVRAQGQEVHVNEVPGQVYDGFFPGASELREMMDYFEAHTYFGPDAEQKIALAQKVATRPPTDFETWAKVHMSA